MCVMVYLKKDSATSEFMVADTMASADYVGIMNTNDDGLEIVDINKLIHDMEQPLNTKSSNLNDKPHTLDYLKSKGIESVISMSFTLSSLKLFKRFGFKAYKAKNNQLEDNLACFFNAELNLFDYYRDMMNKGCISQMGSC